MRRLLLALLIVMLPLRGWMGDVMAMQADSSPALTIEIIAASDPSAPGSSHFYSEMAAFPVSLAPEHCPDHAAAPVHGTAAAAMASTDATAHTHPGGPDDDASLHGGACNACQVCHSVAMSADVQALAALPLPTPAPRAGIADFTSAVPVPGLKPPIS